LYTVINNILFFLGLEGVILLLILGACLLCFGILYAIWTTHAVLICQGADSACFEHYGTLQGLISVLKSLGNGNKVALEQLLEHSYFMAPGLALTGLFITFLYRAVVVGMVRIGLDFYDHSTSTIRRLFVPINLTLKGVIAAFLYNLMIGIGTLLLIIPGIIAAIRFGFYQQALVDNNVGIIDAFKISARVTKGATLRILAVNMIFGIFNIAAYFTFGLSYIISFPALYLMQAYIYRRLLAVTPETREIREAHTKPMHK